MKRIDVFYGGGTYSVGDRDLAQLQRQVSDGFEASGGWMEVNDGEGMERTAYLLLTPGISIALVPVPGNGDGGSGSTESD